MIDRPLLYILIAREPVPMDDTTPEGVFTWRHWCQDVDNRLVGFNQIGPYTISTIFLGMDHGWGRQPPILFKTMIFEKDIDPHPLLIGEEVRLIENVKSELHKMQWRYSTWDRAKRGHRQVVEMMARCIDQGAYR